MNRPLIWGFCLALEALPNPPLPLGSVCCHSVPPPQPRLWQNGRSFSLSVPHIPTAPSLTKCFLPWMPFPFSLQTLLLFRALPTSPLFQEAFLIAWIAGITPAGITLGKNCPLGPAVLFSGFSSLSPLRDYNPLGAPVSVVILPVVEKVLSGQK